MVRPLPADPDLLTAARRLLSLNRLVSGRITADGSALLGLVDLNRPEAGPRTFALGSGDALILGNELRPGSLWVALRRNAAVPPLVTRGAFDRAYGPPAMWETHLVDLQTAELSPPTPHLLPTWSPSPPGGPSARIFLAAGGVPVWFDAEHAAPRPIPGLPPVR